MKNPRSHDDLRMAGEGAVWIGVMPYVAYTAVADMTRMGEWSPENCGGNWVGPRREAAVGATFVGRNRNPRGEWETVATVIEAEPRARFAFCVAPPGEAGTTWRYTFRPDRGGTTVTEAFEWCWTPVPDEGFRGRVGRLLLDEAAAVVADRQRHLQEQVDRTLTALKQVLEGRRSVQP